ncbi:forkhead box protein P1 isoform X1 [Drosophila rhopaloa]|uniref:Forkhead box protein P1 isoform X1 n=1 Tax=Drosophila rhopaloa TaxID=1041015 RepID=A0A6P4ER05_DRORH|nr:forkhead box protein P1 isoform X1 [Drosophila rhopaloa]
MGFVKLITLVKTEFNMHRIHEDEYSEDVKESDFKGSIQKEISVKSRHHISIPDICTDAVKSNCFPQTGFLNSSIAFASHVVKCSSPASSIDESSSTAQHESNPHMHIQGQHMMAPVPDLGFYNVPEFISEQEKLMFSDAERFLRSKDNEVCSNDFSYMHDEFAMRKYYHPLFAHGICRWPGCEMDLEDITSFVKHLNTEHGLDDRSTAQARVQMQVVSQLESHLQKERDRLQAMMHHLYLSKQLLSPTKIDRKDVPGREGKFCRSPLTINSIGRPIRQTNSPSSLNLPMVNSTNLCSIKKRSHDKNSFSINGGLPYMLERAGLDVQQEIHRNREFYKNADVRPPFTYASLIRQVISSNDVYFFGKCKTECGFLCAYLISPLLYIEIYLQSIIDSPDKQLTLNEIYNWFQNTFCYFRRNAATWKNAVRHNLSLHKCFMRVENVKGAVWTVDEIEFYKRRPQRTAGIGNNLTGATNSPDTNYFVAMNIGYVGLK